MKNIKVYKSDKIKIKLTIAATVQLPTLIRSWRDIILFLTPLREFSSFSEASRYLPLKPTSVCFLYDSSWTYPQITMNNYRLEIEWEDVEGLDDPCTYTKETDDFSYIFFPSSPLFFYLSSLIPNGDQDHLPPFPLNRTSLTLHLDNH